MASNTPGVIVPYCRVLTRYSRWRKRSRNDCATSVGVAAGMPHPEDVVVIWNRGAP
jgi:hypothetical protein